jgi:hypothetical protein
MSSCQDYKTSIGILDTIHDFTKTRCTLRLDHVYGVFNLGKDDPRMNVLNKVANLSSFETSFLEKVSDVCDNIFSFRNFPNNINHEQISSYASIKEADFTPATLEKFTTILKNSSHFRISVPKQNQSVNKLIIKHFLKVCFSQSKPEPRIIIHPDMVKYILLDENSSDSSFFQGFSIAQAWDEAPKHRAVCVKVLFPDNPIHTIHILTDSLKLQNSNITVQINFKNNSLLMDFTTSKVNEMNVNVIKFDPNTITFTFDELTNSQWANAGSVNNMCYFITKFQQSSLEELLKESPLFSKFIGILNKIPIPSRAQFFTWLCFLIKQSLDLGQIMIIKYFNDTKNNILFTPRLFPTSRLQIHNIFPINQSQVNISDYTHMLMTGDRICFLQACFQESPVMYIQYEFSTELINIYVSKGKSDNHIKPGQQLPFMIEHTKQYWPLYWKIYWEYVDSLTPNRSQNNCEFSDIIYVWRIACLAELYQHLLQDIAIELPKKRQRTNASNPNPSTREEKRLKTADYPRDFPYIAIKEIKTADYPRGFPYIAIKEIKTADYPHGFPYIAIKEIKTADYPRGFPYKIANEEEVQETIRKLSQNQSILSKVSKEVSDLVYSLYSWISSLWSRSSGMHGGGVELTLNQSIYAQLFLAHDLLLFELSEGEKPHSQLDFDFFREVMEVKYFLWKTLHSHTSNLKSIGIAPTLGHLFAHTSVKILCGCEKLRVESKTEFYGDENIAIIDNILTGQFHAENKSVGVKHAMKIGIEKFLDYAKMFELVPKTDSTWDTIQNKICFQLFAFADLKELVDLISTAAAASRRMSTRRRIKVSYVEHEEPKTKRTDGIFWVNEVKNTLHNLTSITEAMTQALFRTSEQTRLIILSNKTASASEEDEIDLMQHIKIDENHKIHVSETLFRGISWQISSLRICIDNAYKEGKIPPELNVKVKIDNKLNSIRSFIEDYYAFWNVLYQNTWQSIKLPTNSPNKKIKINHLLGNSPKYVDLVNENGGQTLYMYTSTLKDIFDNNQFVNLNDFIPLAQSLKDLNTQSIELQKYLQEYIDFTGTFQNICWKIEDVVGLFEKDLGKLNLICNAFRHDFIWDYVKSVKNQLNVYKPLRSKNIDNSYYQNCVSLYDTAYQTFHDFSEKILSFQPSQNDVIAAASGASGGANSTPATLPQELTRLPQNTQKIRNAEPNPKPKTKPITNPNIPNPKPKTKPITNPNIPNTKPQTKPITNPNNNPNIPNTKLMENYFKDIHLKANLQFLGIEQSMEIVEIVKTYKPEEAYNNLLTWINDPDGNNIWRNVNYYSTVFPVMYNELCNVIRGTVHLILSEDEPNGDETTGGDHEFHEQFNTLFLRDSRKIAEKTLQHIVNLYNQKK